MLARALATGTLVAVLSAAAPVRGECRGDLNGNGVVTVDEILTMVQTALSGCLVAPVVCPGDLDGDGSVTVAEVLTAVDAALNGCTDRPTVTPTAPPTPPHVPTATPTLATPEQPTQTATASASVTPSATQTPSATARGSATPTAMATVTLTGSATPIPSPTPSASMPPSRSPTPAASGTATATPVSPTPSKSPTPSPSTTPSGSPTATPSGTATPTTSATASATASVTPTPSVTVTATASPTPTPSACLFTFDTAQPNILCHFVGPTDNSADCPSALETFLNGDGTNVAVSIGVIINNTPDLVLFAATKVSASEASLVSFQYGQGTASIPVTGTIQLTQAGRILGITISPDTPLGSDLCSFTQYNGTFIGVVGG